MAGRDCTRTVESCIKTGFRTHGVTVAATARAATHTGQVNDSAPLACWCVTTATADHKVSSRHSNAAIFATERIPHYKVL